mmetsp:Transcript_34079/g.67070  ORF Transcript_34079/g.67070 Transcript_34079/m.67070 type:complete len:414 (-) Transcript_34079:51-1292(-)
MIAASTEDCNAGTDECDSAGASSNCSTATSLGHVASRGDRSRNHLVQEALRVLRRESQLRTSESTVLPQRDDSVDLWRGLGDTLGLLEVAVREEDEDGKVTAATHDTETRGVGRGDGNFETVDLGMQLPQDEHVQEVCVYFPVGTGSSQHARSGRVLPMRRHSNGGDTDNAPTSPDIRQDVSAPTLLREGSSGMAKSSASPNMAGLAGVMVISGGATGEAFSRTPPMTLPPAIKRTPAKGSRAGRRGSGGTLGPPPQVQGDHWLAPTATHSSSPSLAVESHHFDAHKRGVTIRPVGPDASTADVGREADGGPWAGDRPLEDDGYTQIHPQVQCTPTSCACTRTLDDSDDEVLEERVPLRLSTGSRPSPGSGRSGRPMSQAAWALAVHEASVATAAAAGGNLFISQQRPTLRPL